MNARWLTPILLACGAGAPAAEPAAAGDIEIATLAAAPPLHREARARGYRVSAFEIKGRWSGDIALPLRPGDLWTPEKQSAVLEAIRDAFDSEPAFAQLLDRGAAASALYIDVEEEKDEAARTVRLIFRPLRVRLSLAKIGDNLLPIPRSASPLRPEAVPKPLLLLNPVLGASHDRATGLAATAQIEGDLLAWPALLAGRGATPDQSASLGLRLHGMRSAENFHAAGAALTHTQRRWGGALRDFSAGAGYEETREPLGGAIRTNAGGRLDAGATLRLAARLRLTGDLGFVHEAEKIGSGSRTRTQLGSGRLLVELPVPASVGGFFRAALWAEHGHSDRGLGSHSRVAARAGYAREFLVAPNQSVGLELEAGGGRLRGAAPAGRRFFGGASAAQFLYDEAAAPGLRTMPSGPLLRSFGRNEATGAAGAAGGDAFWHVNANLTLPIRALAFPLIPADEEVRGMLRNGINVSGRSFLITALKRQGLSAAEARAEADRVLGEIRPATSHIIDAANLYSLKPLLMVDAAGLSGAAGRSTWTAAGGGLQFTIVTAKFELGWMRTLSGPRRGHNGNLLLRLVFQNLF